MEYQIAFGFASEKYNIFFCDPSGAFIYKESRPTYKDAADWVRQMGGTVKGKHGPQ